MDLINKTVSEESFWQFKGQVDFVDKWFLMSTPVPIFLIWASYLAFVLKLGPVYMQKRQPFNLNNILVIYNLVQVVISCWIFYLGSRFLWQHGLIHSACLMDRENTRQYITSSTYYYLSAKITELLDTIFFVLRKRQRQITFLHVYHHSIMMLFSWMTLKYDPTDSGMFLGTINSFVHIIMYTYYGLSAFPGMAKFLWWKKYITTMQLVQFVLIFIQVAISNMISECPPSSTLLYTIILNTFLFLYLFGDFYVKSYKKKNTKKMLTNGEVKNGITDTKYMNGHIENYHKLAEKVQ